VLAAAVEIFARDGPAGSSVRDIARHARIRVSTLYHYFPSKEALYQEVQARADTHIRAIMLEVMALRLDLRATTREALGRLFDFFLANHAYAQLGHRQLLDGEMAHEPTRQIAHRWLGFAEGVLKPAEVQGGIRDVDLVPFMLTIDALLHWHVVGDAVYRRLLGKGLEDPAIAARVREHVIQMVLRALGLD
jgi:AcrR family transcriptional regulator